MAGERNADLESRLAYVVSDIKARLSEGEIKCRAGLHTEYFDFIDSVLQKYSMGGGRGTADAGYMSALLENKMGIIRRNGIKNDYFVIRGTPISEEAKEDVQEYDKLKDEVGVHLRRTVGRKEIYAEDFGKRIEGYITIKLQPDSVEYNTFLARMFGTYEGSFNVTTPEKKHGYKIGDYRGEDIKRALVHVA